VDAAEYDRHAALPEPGGYLVGAGRERGHGGYPDQVGLCVEVNLLDIIVDDDHIEPVVGQRGYRGQTQLRDGVFPRPLVAAEVLLVRRIYEREPVSQTESPRCNPLTASAKPASEGFFKNALRKEPLRLRLTPLYTIPFYALILNIYYPTVLNSQPVGKYFLASVICCKISRFKAAFESILTSGGYVVRNTNRKFLTCFFEDAMFVI